MGGGNKKKKRGKETKSNKKFFYHWIVEPIVVPSVLKTTKLYFMAVGVSDITELLLQT